MTDHHNVTHNLSSCEVKARKKKNQALISQLLKLSYILTTAKFISSATSRKYPFLVVITHFVHVANTHSQYLLLVANTRLW